MFPDLFLDDVFTLETRRLFLRWPNAKDAARFSAIVDRADVAGQMASFALPFTMTDAEAHILKTRDSNLGGRALSLVVAERRAPGRMIGLVGGKFRENPGLDILDIAYFIDPALWGQGYATEAVQALIDAAFLYSEAEAITAGIRVTNNASRKVLERSGFQYEGGSMCVRSAWGDSVSADEYRLKRDTWASLKGWRAPVPSLNETERECA